MRFSSFLIKYAEIAIKGGNRKFFETALVQQIKNTLKHVEGSFRVVRMNGRIYVECLSEYDYDEVTEALKTVFGISWICPVQRIEDHGFEDLLEKTAEYFRAVYDRLDFTFKVEARRARKDFPVDSQTMNREVGAFLLDTFPELSVDVHHPDVLLRIEVRDENINIYSKEIKGQGGMPLGTAGKGMLLLSGGIDSPVAGYLMSKRGLFIDAVYFHAPPYTSERAKQKVVDLARIISRYTGTVRLHVINFTDIQMAIYEKCPHEELTIIMRRYMMRIAESIAKENECGCLITGESLGQVASQTMESLSCTNEVCSLPVFRPLIAFDKQDIIQLSWDIKTYDTSILPYEDCCTIFVAKHPVTHPKAEKIRESEKNMDEVSETLVRAALESDEVISCNYYQQNYLY